MRILVTGGGTGGHVTPLRPVIKALKDLEPQSKIVLMSKSWDRFAKLLDEDPNIDSRVSIPAGKWRRYPNESTLSRLFDVKTHLLNARDVILTGVGLVLAFVYLVFRRPAVIFSKSGPASIPVGIAAKVLRIPVITHDSDTIPGWTHRLIGRWAKLNAVGSAAGVYPYQKDRIRFVGVPIVDLYDAKPTEEDITEARKKLGINKPMIFILGGSLGAKTINDALVAIAPQLNELYQVVHVAGEKNYDKVKQSLPDGLDDYKLLPFIADPTEVHRHYVAASVVITRCGATNTAEAAALGKPTIFIPAQQLLDQQNNAKHIVATESGLVLQDSDLAADPTVLLESIAKIVNDTDYTKTLSKNVLRLGAPQAGLKIAELVLEAANGEA